MTASARDKLNNVGVGKYLVCVSNEKQLYDGRSSIARE